MNLIAQWIARPVESSCGDDGIKDGLTTAEQDELVKLRRRAQRLGHENEILGRVTCTEST